MSGPRYDIVGCGSVVRQHHVPALQLLSGQGDLQVAGCYDLNTQLARELAEILGAERSGSRASPSEGDGVDAVLVATPPTTHAQIAVEYLRAGKSVLVEKPFTASAGEAAELVAEAETHSARVLVDHIRRFHPNVNAARRFLEDRLDEVDGAEATDGQRWNWATASDYLVEDPYGGVIHDSGSHLLDTLLYILGVDDDEAISSSLSRIEKTPPAEPSHECRARLALSRPRGDDIPIELSVSRLRALARGIKVWGSFGLIFLPFTVGSPPLLFRGSGGFKLTAEPVDDESPDPRSAFLLAQRDFNRVLKDFGHESRLDGRRFLLLGHILDSLHTGESP